MATVATVNPVTMPSLGRSDVSDEEREPGAKAEGVKIEKDLLGLLFKKLEENDRHLEENLQSRKRTERLLVETRIELLQARKQLRVAEKERNDFWAAYQASLKTQSVFKERLESIEKQLSDEIGKNKQLTQENTTLKKNRDWLSNRNQQLDERLKKAQEDLQRAEVELRKLQQNKEESEIFIDETLNQQYLSDIMSRSEIQRLTQENQRLEETNKEAYAVITKEISVIDRRASERLRQAQFQGKVIGGAIGTGIGAVGGGVTERCR